MAVLRGAVIYGLDPSIVHVRRAIRTYGIGVIKPFIHGVHPEGKYSNKNLELFSIDSTPREIKLHPRSRSFLRDY